jgi:hypothetical protein
MDFVWPGASRSRLHVRADRLAWRVTPARHDRGAALTRDLEHLAALAEREAAVPAGLPGAGAAAPASS